MKSFAALTVLLTALGITGLAWAQPMAPSAPPSSVSPNPTGGSAMLAAAIIVVAVLVFLGITVKLLDLKRRRESEAVQLQAQISDALLREERVFGLSVTPTAHVPLWSGTPATLELRGQVPSPEVKDAVLRLVNREAARVRPDFHVNDEVAVVPSMARAA
ncbi:MAG TPA: hypothetical protein VID04_07585 [Methylomirabilota bacterium]|jgi:hypothetical protein